MNNQLYSVVKKKKSPLKVGIMLDNLHPPMWIHKIISEIAISDICKLSTVILNNQTKIKKKSIFERFLNILRGKSNFNNYLWYLYQFLDKKKHSQKNTIFQPLNVKELISSAHIHKVKPIKKGAYEYFHSKDISFIKNQNLDVMIRFGFNILKGDILKCSKFGIWSYHHGDNNFFKGGPSGFWEMYEKNPLTGCVLQILTDVLDGGKVIYRSYGSTSNFISLIENRFNLYNKSIPFVMRCLRLLYSQEFLKIERKKVKDRKKIYKTPNNSQMLIFFMRLIYQMLKNRVELLFKVNRDFWYLGYLPKKKLKPKNEKFIKIKSPKGNIWADPFLYCNDNKTYLFFENFSFDQRKGKISCAEMTQEGIKQPVKTVLSENYHVSYPNLFKFKKDHYLIPETSGDRSISIFVAKNFPEKWELKKKIFTGINAVDSTIVRYKKLWFLFSSINEYESSTADELFLFYSINPFAKWIPHPMNPIISDVRSARSAGKIFTYKNNLYRPSQDCSKTYGSRICVNKITKISKSNYKEIFSHYIEPGFNNDGCHTLTFTDSLTVLDFKKTHNIFSR